MKRILIIGCILMAISSITTKADPLYYRFWQGYKVDNYTYQEFRDGLAGEFMPATVDVGKGKGLVSYLPALPYEHTCINNTTCLPDEIALVVYASKEKYDELIKTPEWKKYSQLHWKYFSKNGSHTLVPIIFDQNLQNETAYDILQSPDIWQNYFAVYCVSKKIAMPTEYLRFMQSADRPQNLLSYIVLIEDNYVIEYQLWKDEASYYDALAIIDPIRKKYLASISGADLVLRSIPESQIQTVKYGDGLNIQYNNSIIETP